MVESGPSTRTTKAAPAPSAVPPNVVAEQLVVRMGELLHAYGSPAPRVEGRLNAIADRLGLRADVFSTPTAIHIAFASETGQRVYLRRVQPGEINLGKLVEFDEVLEHVEAGRCDLDTARDRVEAIASAPPRYGPTTIIIAGWAGASGAAAALFGGGLPEVLGAAFIGLLLGQLAHAWPGHSETSGLFDLAAALIVGFMSSLLAHHLGGLSDRLLVLAGLIVLFPGLSLTVALVELATRHLASGTARLGGAFTTLLLLAFGVALGRVLARGLFPIHTPIAPEALPPLALLAAIALSPLALGILFQARRRELGWIWVSAVGAALIGRVGTGALGVELGSLLGALCVGLFSNSFARIKGRPASVTLTPGLLVLVPGSLGYRAADLFMAKEAIAGLTTAFDTTVVGTALVGGVLMANVILPPRRAL